MSKESMKPLYFPGGIKPRQCVSTSLTLSRISPNNSFEGLEQPLVLQAPGRVNLIGEHTDYNNGFCPAGRHPVSDYRCHCHAPGWPVGAAVAELWRNGGTYAGRLALEGMQSRERLRDPTSASSRRSRTGHL